MRRAFRVLVALAAVGIWGSMSDLVAQEDKGPETVTLERSPLGSVTFGHWAHQESAECSDCHHESRPEMPLEAEHQACDDCHVDAPVPPMVTPRSNIFHMAAAGSGLCVDCHRTAAAEGKEVPVQCRECHVRDSGQEDALKLPALVHWFLRR